MTLLYSDPGFLEHKTGRHPERPERLEQVMAHLRRTGLDERCKRPTWAACSLERLSRVHSLEYAASVEAFARQGGGYIEADTAVCPASYNVALRAAGAVADAVTRVLGGEDKHALCLVRPPGHHALEDAAMGFCLFNNVAVGARTATAEFGLNNVLVVDWDVHHGNGTQASFWRDPQTAFLSIHRWPFYPGTGDETETGAGPAQGRILNLPTEMGTSRAAILDRFRSGLEYLASRVKPELILISAGFDAHRDDPVGSLGLETEDFLTLTSIVLDVADAFAGGKVVSVLEGGYNPGILAGCVELHLKELLARESSA